jgi:hypothetical protein
MTDKDFKLLLLQHGRNVDDIVRANRMIEKFIDISGCIIYGGTAIDYALRLVGSKLYSDQTLPFADYDFLSPTNVHNSYDLAMKFHNEDISDSSVITGLHMITMRVLISGYPIADISYIPENIFTKIPTLKYKSESGPVLRIVHPTYQIIDIHTALSYPYANPPIEVYNQRISKDIERYNMLWKYYISPFLGKISKMSKNLVISKVDVPRKPGALYAGLVAYAQIRTMASKSMKISKPRLPISIVETDTNYELDVSWIDGLPIPIDIILNAEDPTAPKAMYNKLMEWFPKSHKELRDNMELSTYLSENKLYPAMRYGESKDNISFACCQHILIYFAVYALLATKNSDLYPVWWTYYNDCIDMLNDLAKFKDPAAMFGNMTWPDLSVIPIADGQKFWNRVNHANIADMKNGTKTVASLFADRPRHFTPSFAGSAQLLDTLKEWDYSSEYFQLDGSKLKK